MESAHTVIPTYHSSSEDLQYLACGFPPVLGRSPTHCKGCRDLIEQYTPSSRHRSSLDLPALVWYAPSRLGYYFVVVVDVSQYPLQPVTLCPFNIPSDPTLEYKSQKHGPPQENVASKEQTDQDHGCTCGMESFHDLGHQLTETPDS